MVRLEKFLWWNDDDRCEIHNFFVPEKFFISTICLSKLNFWAIEIFSILTENFFFIDFLENVKIFYWFNIYDVKANWKRGWNNFSFRIEDCFKSWYDTNIMIKYLYVLAHLRTDKASIFFRFCFGCTNYTNPPQSCNYFNKFSFRLN